MPPNNNLREMVLNHASLASPDLYTALGWLKDLVIGMRKLITECVAQSSLETCIPEHEIRILPNCSWHEVRQELRKAGERDEYLYLVKLLTNYSSPTEVELGVRNLVRVCDEIQLRQTDGEPLVKCAMSDGISVGFPSDSIWDRDQLTVSFNELASGESIQVTREPIDNLARSAHANLICERHRAALLNQDPSAVWDQRDKLFPNLDFGPDVKRPSASLKSALRKLAELDKAAAEWVNVGGPIPPWNGDVTPESKRVNNSERLLNARRFMSNSGTRELFEWHTGYGNKYRIHLRFDGKTRKVEIGYIGPHLPL